jgi:predicted transcriptional regulator
MDISSTKLQLAKKLLDTEDKEVLKYIKALFETRTTDWWDGLPKEVQKSIEIGLKQAEKGETVPHDQVMKKYKKWLKK